MQCRSLQIAALVVALFAADSISKGVTCAARQCAVIVTATRTTTVIVPAARVTISDLQESALPTHTAQRQDNALKPRNTDTEPEYAESAILCSAEGTPTPDISPAVATMPEPRRDETDSRDRNGLSDGAIVGIAIGGSLALILLLLLSVCYFKYGCNRQRIRARKRRRPDSEDTSSPERGKKGPTPPGEYIQLVAPAPARPPRSPPSPSSVSKNGGIIKGPGSESSAQQVPRARMPSPLVPAPSARVGSSAGGSNKKLPALPPGHKDDPPQTLRYNPVSRESSTKETRGARRPVYGGLNYPHQQVPRSPVELPAEGAEKARFPNFSRVSNLSTISDASAFSWVGQADESQVQTPASRRAGGDVNRQSPSP